MQALQHREDIALHWFDPFGCVGMQHLCNIPPRDGICNRIVFWDQEPLRKDALEKFLHEFRPQYQGPLTVVTSERNVTIDSWLKMQNVKVEYYFFHGWAALDWYRGYNFTYLAIPWRQRELTNKIFCPNNIIGGERKHRVDFFGELASRGLVENNVISFPDRCPHEGISAQDLLRERGYHLDVDLPRIIDRPLNHANHSHVIDFWQQSQSCVAHVVTETVYSGDRNHLTEKIFKPIVMQQPFLLIAPRHSLRYLRSYGFETFDSVWDESYDDLEDDQRIGAVADLVQQINTWTPQQLRRNADRLAMIIERNHDWFYKEFAHRLWRELKNLIQRLNDTPVF